MMTWVSPTIKTLVPAPFTSLLYQSWPSNPDLHQLCNGFALLHISHLTGVHWENKETILTNTSSLATGEGHARATHGSKGTNRHHSGATDVGVVAPECLIEYAGASRNKAIP
jgi:hypothetical protein